MKWRKKLCLAVLSAYQILEPKMDSMFNRPWLWKSRAYWISRRPFSLAQGLFPSGDGFFPVGVDHQCQCFTRHSPCPPAHNTTFPSGPPVVSPSITEWQYPAPCCHSIFTNKMLALHPACTIKPASAPRNATTNSDWIMRHKGPQDSGSRRGGLQQNRP